MAVRDVLRIRDVQKATGWSRSTIYQKMTDGKFPKSRKLDPSGKTMVWWEDEVEAFQRGEWSSQT